MGEKNCRLFKDNDNVKQLIMRNKDINTLFFVVEV